MSRAVVVAVVALAFNPSTVEAEAGRSLSLRPAWSTEGVTEQPGLHRETKKKERKRERKKRRKSGVLCGDDT